MIRVRTSRPKLHSYLLALLTLPALLLSASPTEAALISAFTGNTRPAFGGTGTGAGVDGTVNFAVFDRTGGTAADPWGTGSTVALATAFQPGISEGLGGTPPVSSPGLDTNARFLYLFQTVNDGTNTNTISQNSVNVAGLPFPTATSATGTVTSYGRFLRLGFNDNGSGPINGSNPFLGTTGATFGNPSNAVLGVTGVTVIQAGANVLDEPDTVTLGPNSLRALFAAAQPSLLSGAASSLWGYTSNLAPIFPANTAIIDGGTSANGVVPTAVPEPASLLAFCTGLPVLGIYWLWRRRTNMV